jgi:hypothetical protein
MQRQTYTRVHDGPARATRAGSGVQWLLPVALVVSWFVATPAASAAPLPPRQPVITYTPNGPFSSGQLIEVRLPPNRLFKPGASLAIEECAAPPHRGADWREHCDAKTQQPGRLVAGARGSLDFPGYAVDALPDATNLDESASHRPICDLTHPCVLVIALNSSDHDGDHDGDDGADHHSDEAGRSVWSLPFLVGPAVGGGTRRRTPPRCPTCWPFRCSPPVSSVGPSSSVAVGHRRPVDLAAEAHTRLGGWPEPAKADPVPEAISRSCRAPSSGPDRGPPGSRR